MTTLLLLAAAVPALTAVAAADGVCTTADKHDGSCGSVLIQTMSLVDKDASTVAEESLDTADRCDESSWPDKDHGHVCGDCKVLVDRFSSEYKTCDGYCERMGRSCVGAWEEKDDTCTVLHDMACSQTLSSSDAICECSPEQGSSGGDGGSGSGGGTGGDCNGQYGQMQGVVQDEGGSVGSEIRTWSSEECQRECDANAGCQSFTICPGWAKCWMKDRSLVGSEPTTQNSDCRTHYKKCDSAPPSAVSPTPSPPPVSSCTGSSCTVKVMSYNTEYRNYEARLGGYAAKIREIAPAIVGLQECQNRDRLAAESGYTANLDTGRQNYMLFDPTRVTLLSGGWMPIPRDDYAPRAITWGKFMLGSTEIWFFNTHLPHNHNEAASLSTHATIANMLLDKRRELGAENAPTIVVGDMNSHASNFNRHHTGGFESNLEDNGFVWAYTAKGNRGGYPNIDHILYSAAHWTHSGCSDTGTGGSDHTSITCDLTLK